MSLRPDGEDWRVGVVLVAVAEGHGLRLKVDDLKVGDGVDRERKRVGLRHLETLERNRTRDGRGDKDCDSNDGVEQHCSRI